jgi:hypothetical protein
LRNVGTNQDTARWRWGMFVTSIAMHFEIPAHASELHMRSDLNVRVLQWVDERTPEVATSPVRDRGIGKFYG